MNNQLIEKLKEDFNDTWRSITEEQKQEVVLFIIMVIEKEKRKKEELLEQMQKYIALIRKNASQEVLFGASIINKQSSAYVKEQIFDLKMKTSWFLFGKADIFEAVEKLSEGNSAVNTMHLLLNKAKCYDEGRILLNEDEKLELLVQFTNLCTLQREVVKMYEGKIKKVKKVFARQARTIKSESGDQAE